ncbi:MAG: SemiSWEET transporter [Pseudomonadota bacterium]
MSAGPLVDVIGAVAGVMTTVAFIPQVVKTWRTRSTRDISLGMWLLFWLGVALWTVYGALLAAWPIIVANVATLVLSGIVLVIKLGNLGRERD